MKDRGPELPVDNAAAIEALQRLIDARSGKVPTAPRSVGNRWLSPSLVQSVQAPSQADITARRRPVKTAAGRWDTAVSTRRLKGGKRGFAPGIAGQLAAAVALLAGCGLFSYLAWSEAAPRLLARQLTAAVAATGASDQAKQFPAPEERLVLESALDDVGHEGVAAQAGSREHSEIRRLREHNHRLHQRLAALEATLAGD